MVSRQPSTVCLKITQNPFTYPYITNKAITPAKFQSDT